MKDEKTDEKKTDQAQKVAQTPRVPKKGGVARAVGAAIAGVTIGYVAGALTAPASGAETRRRIGRRVEDGAHQVAGKARRSLATAKDEAKSLAKKARKSLISAKDRLAEKAHS